MFSCEFCEFFRNIFLQNTSGRLLLLIDTCLIKSQRRLSVKRSFITGVSFPIQHLKKNTQEVSFSQVCKISLQRSVISRHRINHYSNFAINRPISYISSMTKFIDSRKPVRGLMNNFVYFIHP